MENINDSFWYSSSFENPNHMKMVTEIHKWSKCKEQLAAGFLSPTDTSTTQSLDLRLREYQGQLE